MLRFMITYRVQGEFTEIVEAETLEHAKAICEAKIEDEDFGLELDSADDINFSAYQLHPVLREGKRVETTYVRKSDESL
jgi:hypothetical protein